MPGFLERFAAERGKSRRFVARRPEDLFPASPNFARQFAPHLKDNWYFDSNLSADQVASRARIAARLAGLHYGSDVRINLRTI